MPVGPAPRMKARVVAWDLDSVVKAGPVLTPSRRPSPQHEDLLPEGEGSASQQAYLVVDEQLDGVVTPLDEHDLVGLPGHSVGEWGADARRGTGPQPQADGEGVQLGQRLLDLAIQVVCAEREGDFERIW